MNFYDEAAASYDGHFARPVDRWEDERLAELLAPVVDGREVLDLGCGTGWLADHCSPAEYTGVDCSGPMIAEMTAKHPRAYGIKASVGGEDWPRVIPFDDYDAITATWSLEYLGNLSALLRSLRELASPGTVLALHGSMPRGHRREHFSVKAAPYLPIGPHQLTMASRAAGLPDPRCTGTSALPDSLADLGRGAWRAALRVPAGMHYAALWTWRLI